MKILLWAPFGAGIHYWGPGTSAYRLYEQNKRTDVEVTLVHASDEQGVFPDVFKEQIQLPVFRNKSSFHQLMYLFAAMKWIRNNHHKYDVFHGITAFEYTFRPALLFASFHKPVFLKVTGENGGFGNNSFFSRFLGLSKYRIKNANKITGYISISDMISNNLRKYNINEEKIIKIPNGVNEKKFFPISLAERIELGKNLTIPNRFTFIYVGGLTFNKRIIEVVKAFMNLCEMTDDIQLLIIGPDRSNGVVLDIINEEVEKATQRIKEKIIHIPYTKKPENFYRISDVFVLVSEKEGMSNALLEAMASGLPALVTRISGSEDLISEYKQGLFTNGTIEDIKNKLQWFITNKDLIPTLGEEARSTIIAGYSHKKVFAEHIKTFEKALHTHG